MRISIEEAGEATPGVGDFLLGAPLRFVTGHFLAGWLIELYGWRAMFMLLGLPDRSIETLGQSGGVPGGNTQMLKVSVAGLAV